MLDMQYDIPLTRLKNVGGTMLLFEIHSVPKPQKQTQWCRNRAWDPSKASKESIQWQIRPYAPKEPLQGPVSVSITFYMPIPKATQRNLRHQMILGVAHHIKRPDIDNMAYLVTNAMKEIIYADDSQIVDLHISKRYGEVPKTVIKVIEIDVASNYERT